jgi:hypothetical protein
VGSCSSISDVDAAWAAGFIDGEGYLGTVRASGHIQPRIVAGQCTLEPLEKLRDVFGGCVYAHKKQRVEWRRFWAWQMQGGSCLRVALAIRPFLVVKAEQADILIELSRRIVDGPRNRRAGLPDTERAAREVLATRLRDTRKRNNINLEAAG